MARAKIQLPEKFIFSTELPVRIGDINYGGHLGNDALLSLIHEARLRFLRTHGFSEHDVAGAGIIMADAVIIYKSQSYYGDVLRIEITAGEFSKHACDLFYRITGRDSGKEIARAKTRIAFYDYAAEKTVHVPQEFKNLFTG